MENLVNSENITKMATPLPVIEKPGVLMMDGGASIIRNNENQIQLEQNHPLQKKAMDFDEVIFRNKYATLCTADIRANTRDKKSQANGSIITGHEGVCQVLAVGEGVKDVGIGDLCVLKPHLWRAGRQPDNFRDEEMMGRRQTERMGIEIDGPFSAYGRLNAKQLMKIPEDLLQTTATNMSRRHKDPAIDIPPEALFSLTEPVACVLTGVQVMKEHFELIYGVAEKHQRPGNVLIIGAGPIGILFGLALSLKNWKVVFKDIALEREEAAKQVLNLSSSSKSATCICSLDPENTAKYDTVVVCTNNHAAVQDAEHYVKHGGTIYLMAGFNTSDTNVTTNGKIASLEIIHRLSEPALLRIRTSGSDKLALYSGHSGYRDNCKFSYFKDAMKLIAEEATAIDRMITGIASGLGDESFAGRHGNNLTPDYRSPIKGISAMEIALCGGKNADNQWGEWFKSHLKLVVRV